MSKEKTRCKCCGAYVRPCHNCGARPEKPETHELYDYAPDAARLARIDARARKLRGRSAIDAFIDRECGKVRA